MSLERNLFSSRGFQQPRITVLLLLLLMAAFSSARAQQGSVIKGSVEDVDSKAPLQLATITILNAKDSTLVAFTRVIEDGRFHLHGLKNDSLLLLITYPGYADYVERFDLGEEKGNPEVVAPVIKDFGKIQLTLKSALLEEVVIKGKIAAIKINGDTTEFNAAAYHIKPNSKVEDLLKQLPGIQVDRNGNITAQGQRVNRVLVDGEEFFGDDPTLVTRNIRGDMVAKVQLYDKKSDQAAFTGVDDGNAEKTINIQLKDDKKNGYFGQVELGGGTRQLYNGKGMMNYFKTKQKFSAYGILSTTGNLSLGWEDNQKYGSADDIVFDENGAASMTAYEMNSLDDQSGVYNGEGLPLVKSGGVHYENKWNDDKEAINTNYKIGSFSVAGKKSIINQQYLPAGVMKSSSDQQYDNYKSRQKLDAAYQIKLDASSTLKIALYGVAHTINSNESFITSSYLDDLLLNNSTRTVSDNGTNKQFNSNVFWAKRFRKAGRTLSLDMKQSVSNNKTRGFLFTNNSFYDAGGIQDSVELIDQFKSNNFKSASFSGNLSYSEPVSNELKLVLNYGLGVHNSTAVRNAWNQSVIGKYTSLDSMFSNHYTLRQLIHQGGAVLHYNKGKSLFNAGVKLIHAYYDQLDRMYNNIFKRNYLNWNPQGSYAYQFSRQKQFRVTYSGNNRQPGFDQLQTARVNTDPLNITIGNPDLKPCFYNYLNASYNSYQVVQSRSIYVQLNYSFETDAIVTSISTDAFGKSILQAVNLTSKQNTSFSPYISYQQSLGWWELDGGLGLRANLKRHYGFINGTMNELQTAIYSIRVFVSKYKEGVFDGTISINPTYNRSTSSLQKQINDNGWGLNGYASFSFYLPFKMEIGAHADVNYRAKTPSFQSDYSLLIIDADISKKFLASENLKVTLSVKDLLNQNSGFNRSAMGNMITQTNYNTIGSYWMLSLSWDFNKMGK